MLRTSAINTPIKPPTNNDKIKMINFLGLIGRSGSTAVSMIRTLPISPAFAILSCW